jgi:tRNA(Ile)-lysidine synthase
MSGMSLLTISDSDAVPTAALLRAAIEVAFVGSDQPIVLAVSGGRDSMALMHAVAKWEPARLAAVATFDHGTGSAATDAASLVAADARRLGLTVIRERARQPLRSEAAWRDARWQFLRRVARAFGARVATAHTQDDQVETVVMRAMRASGARGLAALAAPSDVVRPWLAVSRAEVAAWAVSESVPFLHDPTNALLRYQRNRLRHQLLPALEAAHPGFSADMLNIAQRAAQWRRDLDRYVASLDPCRVRDGVIRVPAAPFDRTTDAGAAILWAACFAMIGVALDRRGTHALVRFSKSQRRGAFLTVAGGATAIRVAEGADDVFELRRAARSRVPVSTSAAPSAPMEWTGASEAVPHRLGGWCFHPLVRAGDVATSDDRGLVGLPRGRSVTIRQWHAGDRIHTAAAPAGRRVTRYFSDAHIHVLDRAGWPVVLVDGAILCVPGLCRSLAAPHRPGWPDSIWYRCERELD